MAEGNFTARLCEAIAHCAPDAAQRPPIWRAIADTIAAAAAGFAEEPVARIEAGFAGAGALAWSGRRCDSPGSAVMLNAIAAHAVDYDDVLLDGSLHASAVIAPAILSDAELADQERIVCAFAAGLLAARAVSRRVGRGHRRLGWHGTGIFGAIGAAAAAARLRGFSPAQVRSVLALAAAQAGGMQINFGTLAKSCQAGFAAAAGWRAAQLVAAGADGAPDIFAPHGFADLYGAGDGDPEPDDSYLTPRPDLLALKLYPCCYGAHRLIGAALTARQAASVDPADPELAIEAVVATGGLRSMAYDWPETGLQAKFSARQAVAITLAAGVPRIEHFTDPSIKRDDFRAVASRITVREDPAHEAGGLMKGYARVTIRKGARMLADVERIALPGSPSDPPSTDAVRFKIRDCLGAFETATGRPFAAAQTFGAIPEIAPWFGAAPTTVKA